MPLATGVVEAISVKPLDTPDQYANTHRGSLKIGDDWFSFGTMKNGKAGEIYTKNGLITKGAEIEFMYTVNGTFKNAKKPSVEVLKSGQAQSANTGTTESANAGTESGAVGGKRKYVDNTIGIAVGAAMNQAMVIEAASMKVEGREYPALDSIETTAMDFYELAERLKAQAAAGDIRVTAQEREEGQKALDILNQEFAD